MIVYTLTGESTKNMTSNDRYIAMNRYFRHINEVSWKNLK